MGTNKENVHEGHRKRMRARVIKNGPSSLQTHELVEMILYYSSPRVNTNEKAHELLAEYDNLANLIASEPEDLKRRCDVNDNTAVFFTLINEIVRRFEDERWKPKELIDSSDIAGEYAKFLLKHEKRECFYAICLDSQSRLICPVVISIGTLNETHVYIRSIVEAVIKFNARSVILAHNHPGGSLIPTRSDVETTVNIIKTMNMIDVFVTDHIIVAGNEYLSMSDKGLVKNLI